MLKRVQHDKKKSVIPNLFRNLEFGNDNKLIAFVLVSLLPFFCLQFFKLLLYRLDPIRMSQQVVSR
jgi:hypothetical protein